MFNACVGQIAREDVLTIIRLIAAVVPAFRVERWFLDNLIDRLFIAAYYEGESPRVSDDRTRTIEAARYVCDKSASDLTLSISPPSAIAAGNQVVFLTGDLMLTIRVYRYGKGSVAGVPTDGKIDALFYITGKPVELHPILESIKGIGDAAIIAQCFNAQERMK